MKIYRLVQIELFDSGFLKEVKVNEISWTITAPENAKIVKREEECKKISEAALEEAKSLPRKGRYEKMYESCNRLYAVEQELDDFPMEKLLQLLYKELSSKDVRFICEKEPWIAERFQDYIESHITSDDYDIPLIKYKGIVHITGCSYKTDCGVDYPMQGKHLATQRYGTLEDVTCEKCLNTLRTTNHIST